MKAGRFDIWRHRGSPGELHALDWPTAMPAVLLLEPTSPAIVFGSTVALSTVALSTDGSARLHHMANVRRRSGGGAVLVVPDDLVWIDVVIGRDDPKWNDDIVESFLWLGDVWREALLGLGLDGVDVHRGPLVRTALADRVCFAGLGAGEVTRHGLKVVGLSQRRTKTGARFQGACLLRWNPTPLVNALGLTAADAAAVHTVAAGVGSVIAAPATAGAAIEAAFLTALATR